MNYNEKIKELILYLFPSNSLRESCIKCSKTIGYSSETLYKYCREEVYCKGKKRLFILLDLLKKKKYLLKEKDIILNYKNKILKNENKILKEKKKELEKEKFIFKRDSTKIYNNIQNKKEDLKSKIDNMIVYLQENISRL